MTTMILTTIALLVLQANGVTVPVSAWAVVIASLTMLLIGAILSAEIPTDDAGKEL